MKVDVLQNEGLVLLSRSSGKTLRVSLPEFWETNCKQSLQ